MPRLIYKIFAPHDIDPALYAAFEGVEAGSVAYLVATDPMNSGLNPMYRALIGGCVFGVYSFYVDGIPPHKPISHNPQMPI
jgi:hypothetical protein